MYSGSLQDYQDSLVAISNMPEQSYRLIYKSMHCYLRTIADQIGATITPPINLSDVVIQASLLSSVLAQNPEIEDIANLHYIVAMVLEQQGAIIARKYVFDQIDINPAENDYWYQMTLAFLHYLAGGFRIQAMTILNNFKSIVNQIDTPEYRRSYIDMQNLFSDKYNFDQRRFFIQNEKTEQLISQIQGNRVANLKDLGLGNETAWLEQRGIFGDTAVKFWEKYLRELTKRGITTFTKEQVSGNFEWLRNNNDLLVVLPTGSGKTIIGELQTALVLAEGKQVVWLLPMRSLVRQTKKEMQEAFEKLGIKVQELPITDDYIPLFADSVSPDPLIAITTPEKFSALIRVNEDVIKNLGLLVVDEAQNLFDESRGFSIESDLYQVNKKNPSCRVCLLSAISDKVDKLEKFHSRFRSETELTKIISINRPTRVSYGVLTSSFNENQQTPKVVCYPPLGNMDSPIILNLPVTRARSPYGPSDLVKKLLKENHDSNLRKIIFVNTKPTCESQAKNIISSNVKLTLPENIIGDLGRIHVERGDDSPFIASYNQKIAPHHGSLPKNEQSLIEKWTRNGFIKTIIATTTLAQGVNLPFDISIVCFLRWQANLPATELSVAEVLNMLGRAGRAGMVSDGLALIAKRNPQFREESDMVLQNNQRWFFTTALDTDQLIGLSNILFNLEKEQFILENWLTELTGFKFGEAMSLLSLIAKAGLQENNDSLQDKIKSFLENYPSIIDLQELITNDINVSEYFCQKLLPIASDMASYPSDVIRVVSITGLPIEFVSSILFHITEQNMTEIDNSIQWANNVIFTCLELCKDRYWFVELMKTTETYTIDYLEAFDAILGWQNGDTLVQIEEVFINSFPRNKPIHVGTFLNYKVPVLAQFWGCLAVCEKIVYGENSHYFDFIQPFIRNGVDSISKLVWLKEIGNIDRVLAHRLDSIHIIEDVEELDVLQKIIRHQLLSWKINKTIIPPSLGLEETKALSSILEDLYIP